MDLRVRRDPSALPAGTAACMGAFDGMHRGHQALIDAARAGGHPVALVTFEPHPSRVLAPDRAPRLLQSEAQRLRVGAWLGLAELVVLRFDRELSLLSPSAFVQRYLLEGLRPAKLVVGRDFRFGAARKGDVARLREILEGSPIALEVVDPVPIDGATAQGKLSSTDVRRAVEAGDVAAADAMLGRPYAMAGTIVMGARRGREIGFPTANLEYGDVVVPQLGIYASALCVWDRASPDYGAVWPAVTSVGKNPTFTTGDAPTTVESFVLDQDLGERLYGVDVEVSLISRLRGEVKYTTVEALVEQIRADVEAARPHVTDANLARVISPP